MNLGIATLAGSILFANFKDKPNIGIPHNYSENINTRLLIGEYRPILPCIFLCDIRRFLAIFDIKVSQANIWWWKLHKKSIM